MLNSIDLLREWVRACLRSELITEASPLQWKHFVGGDTGNPVVQKSIDKGALNTYEISKATPGFAFDPADTDAAVAQFTKGEQPEVVASLVAGDPVTLVTLNQSDLLQKGSNRFAVVEIQKGPQTGMHAIVPLARLAHNMGAGGKKGAISGQVLGQAVEHAVAGGLLGKSDAEILKAAKADQRLADTIAAASDEEVARFDQVVAAAAKLVRPWGSKLGITAARVEDESDTALVDVPAQNANGPLAIHVKYNDPNRLFGLQQKSSTTPTGDVVSSGSPSTLIFRNVRAEYVRKHLLSASAYQEWLKKNPDYSRDMAGELKIIASKGGTNDGTVQPVLLPRQFVRRDSEPGDMVTMLRDPQNQFIDAMESAGYLDTLADEIKDNLAPEGAPTYYFKFNDGASKLEVVSFDLSEVEFDITPTNDGKMNAFTVAAVFPDGRRVEEVLLVALSSSRRGHPPQILNGKNYSEIAGK